MQNLKKYFLTLLLTERKFRSIFNPFLADFQKPELLLAYKRIFSQLENFIEMLFLFLRLSKQVKI